MISLDKTRLISFLHDFYLLTGLNTAIYSDSMEEIASYPGNSKFCNCIYESSLKNVCLMSNKESFNSIHSDFKIKNCPFALWDTVTPIKSSEKIIGYLMVGQARNASTKTCDVFNKSFTEFLKDNNLDVNLLKKYYSLLPAMDLEHMQACIKIILACIDNLISSNIIADKSDLFANEIESYINEHINEELTVQTFCNHFYISKAHLYRLSKKHLGCDISTYVRNKRLSLAKRLLKETNLPIAEIAIRVGIPDYNYFNKVFKKFGGGGGYLPQNSESKAKNNFFNKLSDKLYFF